MSGDRFTPVRVAEIDATIPVAPIAGCAGHLALRVLVRWRGRPLGWLHVACPDDVVSAGYLESAMRRELGDRLREAALRERLAATRELARGEPLPTISVVVCTRDRAASLERCLESLAALDYPEFEIVIVDNAPATDETRTLVARFPVRYVREERPGLDWARNRGLAEARHGIVAYTDDDVRVDRRWLRGIALGFADPAVQLVTGLVAPAELETDAQVIFEDWYGGMGKGFRGRSHDADALGPRDRLGAHHLGVGANMAFRREWLARLGGFDTALDVGTASRGGGDLDAFHRTMAAGGTTRYEPRALVWHHHRREMSALRRQLADNGCAFGVFLLTRIARHERPRRAVLRYAIGTWLWWLLLRIPRWLLRRERLPLLLQAAELRGVVQAPWAWYASYRDDRRLRRHDDGPSPQLAQAASPHAPVSSDIT